MATSQSKAEMISAKYTFTDSYSFDGNEVINYFEDHSDGKSDSADIRYDNKSLLLDEGNSKYVFKTLCHNAGLEI